MARLNLKEIARVKRLIAEREARGEPTTSLRQSLLVLEELDAKQARKTEQRGEKAQGDLGI